MKKKLSWNLNRILLYKIGTCELLDILYFSWIYHIYEILRDILQLLRSLSLNLTDYINLFKAPLRKNRFKKSPPFFGIEKRAQMTNATMLLAFQSLKPIEQFHIHVRFKFKRLLQWVHCFLSTKRMCSRAPVQCKLRLWDDVIENVLKNKILEMRYSMKRTGAHVSFHSQEYKTYITEQL